MDKPTLRIPLESWKKLFAYIDLVDAEITGFFDVEFNEEKKEFVMGEVYLVKQQAGCADVEMDEESIAKFNFELIKQGVEQLPRGWWHSHVNMGTFWSSTDEQTINEDFYNETFTVSLVVNKSRETKACLVVREPIPEAHMQTKLGILKPAVRLDDLEVKVGFEYQTIPAALKAEVKNKVTTRKAIVYKAGKNKWTFGKKGGGSVLFLPKDRKLAENKVDTLDLVKEWSARFGEWVYKNERTGDIWRDIYSVDPVNEFNHRLKDRTTKEGSNGIWVPLRDGERCPECNFVHPHHTAECETGWEQEKVEREGYLD